MIVPLYEYGMIPPLRIKWLENSRFSLNYKQSGIAISKACYCCKRDLRETKKREIKDISASCLSLLWIPCSKCIRHFKMSIREIQYMTDCLLQEYYEDVNGGLGFFCDCDGCAIRFSDISDWMIDKRIANIFRDFAIETIHLIWRYVPSATSKKTQFPDYLLGRFYPELYSIVRRINNNCFMWSLMFGFMQRYVPSQMQLTSLSKKMVRMIGNQDDTVYIPIEIIDKIISYCLLDTSEWVRITYGKSMISYIEAD